MGMGVVDWGCCNGYIYSLEVGLVLRSCQCDLVLCRRIDWAVGTSAMVPWMDTAYEMGVPLSNGGVDYAVVD